MHCALLRRINIQRSEQLSKICLNQKTNFICIGDSKGFLQVINYPQIEAQTQPISREESFSQRQNCFQYIQNTHHHGSINLISWNINYNKLTTVDLEGTLIVWTKKNGVFDKEMVNNREESYIKDVKWSKNGEYICFIYDDGQIFTGLVNGQHEWYNSLQKKLAFVEFSPDNKKILISEKKENIYIFTMSGQQNGQINLPEPYNEYDIASIDWWCDYRKYFNPNLNETNNKETKNTTNFIDNNIITNNNENTTILVDQNNIVNENECNSFRKHLMIAFKNGNLLFFDDENDKEPIKFKTNELSKIMGAQWEVKGTYYIVVGNINDSKGDNKSVNNGRALALFYNLNNELIKIIVCPSKIFSFSLGNSTTIALEAQKLIYTGFIKYNYKWAFFSNTIVVAYLVSDNKYNVIYLDIENNAKLCKIIYNIIGIISNDLYCAIFTENKDGQYNILFTNNFGNVLENRKCPIKPVFYVINEEYLIVSDGNYIYVLQFKGNINNRKKIGEKSSIISNVVGMSIYQSIKLDTKSMFELVFFIDDEDIDINNNNYDYNTYIEGTHTKITNNKILAMTISSNYLFISRSFGQVFRYDLSTLKIDNKFNFGEKIKKMGISPFETYLWTIDNEDMLRIHNIKYQNEEENKKMEQFIQKEVWEIEWCHKREDYDENFNDNLSFVTVERNKLYFYSDLHHESDPYICTDYLAMYIDNEAIAVKLEDLIKYKNNSTINPNNYIKKYENKILANFNSMLDTGKNFDEIYDYVTKNPSKKLWQTLSQKALENRDFDTAHKSMIQMNDYNGLEFLKEIKNVEDPEVQKAEIAQFNSQYDEASKLYTKNGRNDLNLAMMMKLGRWDKVSEIMNKSGNKSFASKEDMMKIMNNNYADELFEKKEYDKAEEYYKKAGNINGLTNCYFAKEDYDKAASMLEVIPEEDEYLEEVGNKFMGLGMCREAVIAFTKHGNIKKGIESYIACNKWEEAIELSSKNGFMYMEQLVNKFSDEFRLSGQKLNLLNLYKKANMSVEVHKNLKEIANDMKRANLSPLIIKKIYVLAALELERYKAQINEQINQEMQINDNNNNIEKNENKKDINYREEALQKEIDKIISNHWRGAEAYHYYLLCQVQLHKKQYKECCKTVMRLKFYEDIIGTEDVYRLIAVCSYMNKCYKFFSDALCILSNDEKINKIRRRKYKELAKDIFMKISPDNLEEKFYKCPNDKCNEPISEYDTYCNQCGYLLYGCVLTGRSILDNHYFKCKQCRSKTIKSEVKKNPFKHCPLCHVALFNKKKENESENEG